MLNESGIEPLDLRVLVLPDEVAKKSSGGIIIPETKLEKDQYAKLEATIVAVGENAWEEACARSPNFSRPVAGDRVLIGKYSGILHTGKDGRDYRILNDEDVIARLVEA